MIWKRCIAFRNITATLIWPDKSFFDAENQEVFNFGKHKGRLVEEVFTNEPAYYDWMMRGSFPLYTKKNHHCHQR